MRVILSKVGWLVAFGMISSHQAFAQFTNRSSVMDGSGGQSAGGSYTNFSAAGQPGGIQESSGGSYVNQAGFLQTFMLKPGLDTDGDGLANEIDQDNDGDQLTDATEISGNGFTPVTSTQVNQADSDGDDVIDGAEAAAGTDPTDAMSIFEVFRIAQSSGQQILWTARGGKTYIIHVRTNLLSGEFSPIATNLAVGGSAPWFVVTNSFVDVSSLPAEFYAVEVVP